MYINKAEKESRTRARQDVRSLGKYSAGSGLKIWSIAGKRITAGVMQICRLGETGIAG